MNKFILYLAPLSIITPFLMLSSLSIDAQEDGRSFPTNQNHTAYQYVCDNSGSMLSAVDVLVATGEHSRFLELLSMYDPEGYGILSDEELSDKTIWAPSDKAFEAVVDQIDEKKPEEIKVIIGYHISPPQSRPDGRYEIITPDYLKRNSPETFRTRTGVLTGSDQRVTSDYNGEVLSINNIEVGSLSWCNQAGSVFSLNQVILSVEPPSAFTKLRNRVVRILFYDDIRFFIYSTALSICIGSVLGLAISRNKKKGFKVLKS